MSVNEQVTAGGSFGYQTVSLSDIGSGLAKLLPEGGSAEFSRSGAHNAIFPLASAEHLVPLDILLEKLAIFHPSRFFVIVPDLQSHEMTGEITARCHLLPSSKDGITEHLCSEVIRLRVPPDAVQAFPSVLRSQFLPGVSTDLFLIDGRVSAEWLARTIALSERVYLDSALFEGRSEVFDLLGGFRGSCIDLQWVGLGSWREQIKIIMSHPLCPGLVRGVDRIEIVAAHSAKRVGALPISAALLAGWFIDRLGLQVQGMAGDGFDCLNGEGGAVRIVFQLSTGDPVRPSDSADSFSASWTSGDGGGSILSALVHGIIRGGVQVAARTELRDGSLESSVRASQTVRFARPTEDESFEGRLRRYFAIGESIFNYRPALRAAIELQRRWNEKKR